MNLVVRSFIVMLVNFVVLESERAREKETVSERELSEKKSNHHSMSDRPLLSDSKRITVLMITNGRNDD